jgi:hypothetical protein
MKDEKLHSLNITSIKLEASNSIRIVKKCFAVFTEVWGRVQNTKFSL